METTEQIMPVENITFTHPSVYPTLEQNGLDPASYNGQESPCGQMDFISGTIQRPKTGPGALCWCPCKKKIPAGRRWNSKFYDTIRCHNRYWIPRMKQVIAVAEIDSERDRAEKRQTLAMQFIREHPEVIIWIANKIREDIQKGFRVQFRLWWELSKREFNLHPNDHDEPYVKEMVIRTNPEFKKHIRMKEKK